jgi:hypothetical protein
MAMEFITASVYRECMWKHWRRAVKFGNTKTATPEAYFGFSAFDVAELHFQMVGQGDGLWFRLKDGRVIDRHGKPCASDASLYDQSVN